MSESAARIKLFFRSIVA